ncbi:type II secretion system minor pseudopilin GspJ [Sphingorhabdus wooponensis]|uniref:Type II secretion system protein J n=1 Tax=Sphingorhabdus wooponensis TaxID=940136 RepID=A0A3R8RCZ3_9SPHN|nr:type II secretion system minor pseudopilin GspJ [Sphingorhabdus wooponensis]RRQ52148.1 type II secretion system protein GspJ [Sphingorhabdus wooponensis]
MTETRHSEAGFTLIELLVALAIFALISVAGVMLLRSGSDTQIAVKKRLEEMALSNRLTNSLEGDLAQAIARPVRDQSGQPVPAFTQSEVSMPNVLFAFVRAGWSNLDSAPRAGLQRVAYILEGGALKRLSWPMLDGTAPTDSAVLLEGVTSVTVEFRDDKGAWRDDWTATDADALPRAIALNVDLVGEPRQRMLFLVGPQTRVAPPSFGTGA